MTGPTSSKSPTTRRIPTKLLPSISGARCTSSISRSGTGAFQTARGRTHDRRLLRLRHGAIHARTGARHGALIQLAAGFDAFACAVAHHYDLPKPDRASFWEANWVAQLVGVAEPEVRDLIQAVADDPNYAGLKF